MRPAQPGIHVWSADVKLLLIDLGLLEYKKAFSLQKQLVEKRIGRDIEENLLLVVEHPPVFTLGKRGGREYLLVAEKQLKDKGIDIVETSRGGVITYHGPGQLVVYPLFRLKEFGLSLVEFVRMLEELMIQTAGSFGVPLNRDKRNVGVWHEDKKVGSIGIALRKGINYHGLALNVNMDLRPFSWISPCGLSSVSVTSLDAISSKRIELPDVKQKMLGCLSTLLEVEVEQTPLEQVSKEVLYEDG